MWKQKLNTINISRENKDESALINWIFESHNWIEYKPGYYKCDWCGLGVTNTIGIGLDFPLCKSNPIIKKFLGKKIVEIKRLCENCE